MTEKISRASEIYINGDHELFGPDHEWNKRSRMDEQKAVTIEIGKLQLLPGDTLVIRCPEGWTPDHISNFHEWLDAVNVLPDGVKILMLPEGSDIGVLRPIPGFN